MKKFMILCVIWGWLLPAICEAQSVEARLAGVEEAVKQADKRIDELRGDINTRLNELRNDMNSRLAAMENRLSTLKLQQDSLVMWAAIIFIVFAGGFTVAVAVLAMSLASLKARMDVFDRRLKDINELFKPLNDPIDKLKYRK